MPLLFEALPPGLAEHFDPAAPWLLLGKPLEALLASLPGERIEIALEPGIGLSGYGIVIESGARVAPGATLTAPLFLGSSAEVRTGAVLRGGCWIGAGAIVGTNTEVKRSILLGRARAPHLAYIGDSILGAGVNLGAGTVLSNFRHDGGEIAIPAGGASLATGRRKLGAILGDDVAVGCNSVLHPGVVVGRGTQLYPGVMLRSGVYPADHIVKLTQQLDVTPRRET